MEVISTVNICSHQPRIPHVCLAKSAKIRKKVYCRSPYDDHSPPSSSKSKIKVHERKETAIDYEVIMIAFCTFARFSVQFILLFNRLNSANRFSC